MRPAAQGYPYVAGKRTDVGALAAYYSYPYPGLRGVKMAFKKLHLIYAQRFCPQLHLLAFTGKAIGPFASYLYGTGGTCMITPVWLFRASRTRASVMCPVG